jgi:hypothetical protein
MKNTTKNKGYIQKKIIINGQKPTNEGKAYYNKTKKVSKTD